MAHIRKLKNGTFQASVFVGTLTDGKKKYEYITCDTEKECKTRARELETDIENRAYSNYANMRFDVWSEKWVLVSMHELTSGTVKGYKAYINNHFIPFFGNMKLKNIQEMHVKEFVTNKLKELSSTTVRKMFFLLSWILHDALKIKNPCRDITPPKTNKYKPNVLDEAGFNLIHNALKNTWDEIPLLLAAYCGMRAGEIFALKWDDIKKDEGLIKIDESRAITEDEGYINKSPKSERGYRQVATPSIVFDLIERHRITQKAINNYLFMIRPDSYSERFGKLIDRHNIAIRQIKRGKTCKDDYNVIYEHKNKIQFNVQGEVLPDIRFHDLRHYHATILHKHGISDQYAAERLGHDIMVLKKIYQHLELDVKKDIDNKVVSIFK
jgi:integrase